MRRRDVQKVRKDYLDTTDLTEEEKALIHPFQFLCASGFAIECTLREEIKDQFERLLGEQVQAKKENNVRYGLFGFEAGGSYDETEDTQTLTAGWDAEAGKLTISPTPAFGCCTLLGV